MTRPLRAVLVAALLAALSLPLTPARAADDKGVRRFALVIGANDGGADRVALRYAVTDAHAMAAVLESLGGVAARDRVVLEEPDAATVMAAFDDLGRRIGAARAGHRRAELVVYYSGHSDEYGLLLGGARLAYKDLRRAIEAAPADVKIAIVDACASGALLRKKGGVRVKPFLVDQSTDVSGQAFLTSSSADEVAQESDRIGASFFTHHLVSGLRGAADASGDGRVTLVEAYQFAFEETLARTEHTQGGAQHPNYDFDLTGSGDIVITDLRAMRSSLALAEGLSGRFFVRDAAERLVAEVRKRPGRPIVLGLEAGIYTVSTVADGQVLSALVSLPSGGATVLQAADLVAQGPTVAHRARGDFEAVHDDDPAPSVLVVTEPPAEPEYVAHARVSVVGPLAFPGADYVDGVSFGLIGDHLEGLTGYQGSLVYNVVHGDVHGVQSAVAVNVAGGFLDGAQLSAGVNVAGDVQGAQIAAAVNSAGMVEGAQVSGGLNVASELRGAQIGLINIAGHVTGAQIGVINYADSVDGVSLGLLPIVADGYNVVELWGDTTFAMNANLRVGAPFLHAVLSVGVAHPDSPDRCVLRLGAGLGAHADAGPVYMDVDVLAWALAGKGCAMDHLADDEVLTAARVTIGVPLTSGLALFIGGAANLEIALADHDFPGPMLVDNRRHDDGTPFETRLFASFFAGVRIF